MHALQAAWDSLRYGGAMVYPLLVLGVLAIAIMLDRAVAYFRCLRLPAALANLVETYGFAWEELERQLAQLGPANAYGRLSRKAWPCPKLGLTVLTWKGGVSYFALRRGSSVAMQTACLTAQR